jgi:excisionase family DNA binding protein
MRDFAFEFIAGGKEMHVLDDWAERPEIAKELKIALRTLSSWTHRPNGIPHARIGNKTLYYRPAVKAWLEKQIRQPNLRRSA